MKLWALLSVSSGFPLWMKWHQRNLLSLVLCLLWNSTKYEISINLWNFWALLSVSDYHCKRSESRTNLWNFWALLSVSFGIPLSMKSVYIYETFEPCSLSPITTVKEVKAEQIYETFELCFLSPLDFRCERSEIRSNLCFLSPLYFHCQRNEIRANL